MAVATIGVGMLGAPRIATADILITVTANGTTSTFDGVSDTAFSTPTFAIGGATGYSAQIDAVLTNFPGGPISSIATTVNITPAVDSPADLTVQVQIVNPVGPPVNSNKLWTAPSSTPVLVSAGTTFVPQLGLTSGTVTTHTFFSSTSSATTTGLTGSGPTAMTTLPGGSPGFVTSLMSNPAGTFTLSQTVVITSLVATAGVNVAFAGSSGVQQLVPEPSTMALAGLGALGLIGYGLRRRKALGA